MSTFDCRTCGACCGPGSDEESYVSLEDEDVARLSTRYRRQVFPQRGLCYGRALTTKRTSSGCVCVALRGTVGQRVSCAIYERRPLACRVFCRGGRDCLDARRAVGLPGRAPDKRKARMPAKASEPLAPKSHPRDLRPLKQWPVAKPTT